MPPLSESEQALWQLDALINVRGFHVDVALAEAAQRIVEQSLTAINTELAALTDGRITSIAQVGALKTLLQEHGHDVKGVTKRSVAAVLAHNPDEHIRRILELRREGGKASAGKLDALLRMADGGRLRGTMKFYGAATGRWSGSGFQPHNLARAQPSDPDAAIAAVISGDIERARAIGPPLDVVASLSRSLICAAPGHVLIAADFSAIESRVLAWLAGETWKLDTYRKFDATGDPNCEPYCVTAARVLRRPVTPGNEDDRQLGKMLDLAFGFGGAAGAFARIAPDAGFSDTDIENFKSRWRAAHPATTAFWYGLHRALKRALTGGLPIAFKNLAAEKRANNLHLKLPSGRELVYPQAHIEPGQYDDEIVFKDNFGGWRDARGWHGVFVENVVQAIARDLLAHAMPKLEAAGYPIVLHVHDEIVAEVPEDFGSAKDFARLMVELPPWAAGLPLVAKGSRRSRYAKEKSAPMLEADLTIPEFLNRTRAPFPPPTMLDALIAADLMVTPIIDAPTLVPTLVDTNTTATIHVTIFRNEKAQEFKVKNLMLAELRELVMTTTAADKYDLPLLKLAIFGTVRTKKNCLRHDDNVTAITGIEGDYDGKVTAFEDAVAAIRAAKLTALVFTSPSYKKDAPKWRVLLPTSTQLPPAERVKLMGRINGVLCGVLAGESFVLSQPFYFGCVNSNPEHKAVLIDGDFIDLRDDLDAEALGKQGTSQDERVSDEDCVDDILTGTDFHNSMLTLSSRWASQGVSVEESTERLEYLMDESAAPRDDRWQQRRADIRRTVEFAAEKFAPAIEAPVSNGGEYANMIREAKTVIRDAPAEPPPPLPFIDMSRWDDEDPPPREWAGSDRFPLYQTSLLSGEGAVGKSILDLQLAFAHVFGGEWLDVYPMPGPALFIDAEDDRDELHRRAAKIAAHYRGTFAEAIRGGLHLMSLAGHDAVLAAPSRSGKIESTALYKQLLEAAGDLKPKLIGIASSANVFAGSENDRTQVQQFVSLLTRIAIVAGGAVQLITHPSLTGINTDTGLSGNTAWHNSVRARAYMKGVKPEAGEQPDTELRELSFRKNNYGPITASIVLRFQNGLFLPVPGATSLDQAGREETARDVFLTLLQRFTTANRDVSASVSVSYAPAVFSREDEAKHQ